MNAASVRLKGMPFIEPPYLHPSDATQPQASDTTRLERRAVLDLSVDEEFLRGEKVGASLTGPLRSALSILAVREVRQLPPLTETEFLASAALHGTAANRRRQRQLDVLISLRLVRRDENCVHATVAGIGAAVRLNPRDFEHCQPSRMLLRAMRRLEIGVIGG